MTDPTALLAAGLLLGGALSLASAALAGSLIFRALRMLLDDDGGGDDGDGWEEVPLPPFSGVVLRSGDEIRN